MEEIFQAYQDVCEFRLIYIKEEHAADTKRAAPYAKKLGITEHNNYGERCTTANRLLNDESLTVPFLIDDMADSVNEAYRAFPDRIFLVRSDGRLAIAAAKGPRGFRPALVKAKKWLAEFRNTSQEPTLPDGAAASGKPRHVMKETSPVSQEPDSPERVRD